MSTDNLLEPLANGEIYQEVERTVDREEEVTYSAENGKPCGSETTATRIRIIDIRVEEVLGHVKD